MQGAVANLKPSAGQAPAVPVHSSATSHCPEVPRHTVAADLNTSTQVVASVPVQWSAGSSSQVSPCELPRHGAVANLKASAGQAPAVPVHSSATSHWPALPRHTVAADLNTSTQVVASLPVQ